MHPSPWTLVLFDFEGQPIRVLTNGQDSPWFVAADVCRALQLPETHKAIRRLAPEEKGRTPVPTAGGRQTMTTINEPGFYNLVLASRRPQARRLQRWLIHQLLPAIHRSGTGAIPLTVRPPIDSSPQAPSTAQQQRVQALLLIAQALAQLPGVSANAAMASALACIEQNTGLQLAALRQMLPAGSELAQEPG